VSRGVPQQAGKLPGNLAETEVVSEHTVAPPDCYFILCCDITETFQDLCLIQRQLFAAAI
jgi:hypothetical protein